MKTVTLALICCTSAFAVGSACSGPTTTMNWSSASTWTCTGGNSTIPNDGDTVTISGNLVLDVNVGTFGNGIFNITVNNAVANFTSDCISPHTITFGSTGNTGGTNMYGINLNLGTVSFNCPVSDYVLLQSGTSNPFFAINHHNFLNAGQTITLNLQGVVIGRNCGVGSLGPTDLYNCIDFQGDNGTRYLTINHMELQPGQDTISIAHTNAVADNAISIQNTTWVNRSGHYAIALDGQNQTGRAYVFSNLTDYLPSFTGGNTIYYASGAPDGLTASGDAVLNGPGNPTTFLFSVSTGNTTASPALVDYLVDFFNPSDSGNSQAVAVAYSSGSAQSTVSHSMTENACAAFNIGTGTTIWYGNWSSTLAQVGGCQGTYITYAGGGTINGTIDHNMMYFGQLPTGGNPLIGVLAYTDLAMGSTVALTIKNSSFVMPTPPVNNLVQSTNYINGDGGIQPTMGSVFMDNIVVGGYYGIADYAANVWGTSCPGGLVGLCNNDVIGATINYFTLGTSTNYGTSHPNTMYGDLTVAPQFAVPSRRMEDFDAYLSGAGTPAHIFQVLAARDGLTSFTGQAGGLQFDPNYSPQFMYSYLTAGFAPAATVLARASSTGSYIGAQPLYIHGFWF